VRALSHLAISFVYIVLFIQMWSRTYGIAIYSFSVCMSICSYGYFIFLQLELYLELTPETGNQCYNLAALGQK
jgi:hypothetical protein